MTIRNFKNDDLPALVDFVDACNSWQGEGRALGKESFRQLLGQPGLDPEQNCFLQEAAAGQIQGFCLVIAEPPIGRSVLELQTAPELVGTALDSELLQRGVQRAARLDVGVAHLCLSDPGPRSGILKQAGFSEARVYWDMVWQGETIPESTVADGFVVRPFNPGESGDAALLTQVQNDAFGGSWGFCPNTVEQIEYRVGMVNTPPDGIFFLQNGKETAGYCWTCLTPVPSGIRGLIGMIGVVPAYRGRGISSGLLTAAMYFLQGLNVAEIALQVDGGNTPATRLYTSVGFEKTGELHWFERGLSNVDTPA